MKPLALTAALLPIEPEREEQAKRDFLPEIQKYAKVKVSADDVHVRGMRVANSQPVSFFLKFTPDALNEVAALLPGRPVMMEHNYDDASGPVGRFFAAKREFRQPTARAPRDESYAVDALFYTLAKDPIGDVVARRIDFGIYTEASLGWYPSDLTCSICQGDIRDYAACPHMPGEIYEEGGLAVGNMSGVLDVLEASIVFAGAARGTEVYNPAATLASKFGAEAAAKASPTTMAGLIGDAERAGGIFGMGAEGLRSKIKTLAMSRDRYDTMGEAQRAARDLFFRADKGTETADGYRFTQKAVAEDQAKYLKTIKVKAGVTAEFVKLPKDQERKESSNGDAFESLFSQVDSH